MNENLTSIVDGAVDSSLPPITPHTHIAEQLDHIKSISTSKPAGYLTRLVELSGSMHEEVALTALQSLLVIKDERVPAHLLRLLANTNFSSQRRFLMLKIVMEASTPLDSSILEKILVNEKDVIVKSGLVKVFAKNAGSNGVPLLIRCLNDGDPRVRANTVEVIESQKISGCEREIVKLLNDSENRVKVNAAKYLVKIGYQQAFLTLRSMLVSPEVWLRDSVIFALGEIADQPSLVLLRAALKDPNQGIRLSVLKALAKINNAASRQILKGATADGDPIVAQVAMSLFEKIKDMPVVAQVPTVGQKVEQKVEQKIEQPKTPLPPFTKGGLGDVPFTKGGLGEGTPKFEKPRSAEIYAKLCSGDVETQKKGMADVVFVMGPDQMVLLNKAIELPDESIRIAAVKLLSRKRTPEAKEMLKRLSADSNETLSSLAKKALMLLK